MSEKTKEELERDIGILSDSINVHLRFGHDAAEHIKKLEDLHLKMLKLINEDKSLKQFL